MKLAILFHRLGPYHHARLKALSVQTEITAVEFSSVDNTYAWDVVKTNNSYPVISLFSDADIETRPIDAVRSRMDSTLGELHPQAVAIPGWSSPAALAALAWCCDTKTPAILMSDSTAEDEPRSRWKEWIKSRVVRLFSTAIVGGIRHVDYVVALGLPHERVFTSYGVVDNAYFCTRSDEARGDAHALRVRYDLPNQYFLASNRFIEKKNLPRLLEAYAAYERQAGVDAWDLVLLGDGPLMPALKDQIAHLGLAERVRLPGFKQYDELPIYYGLANAFIQPSTSEQWGLVVNEAMAAGLPVVVSERCGCAPDLVRNSLNGFTFDPYDVDGLTALMLQMSGGRFDLAAMGRASREIIPVKSPKKFAENMLKAADAALAIPRPRAGWFDRALLWVLMHR